MGPSDTGCLRISIGLMLFWGLVLVAIASLSGCASAPQTAATQVYCVPMVGYTREQQEEIAREYETVKLGHPMIVMVIGDYLKMRDADKACDDYSKKAQK